jgi:hypothetical protein
VNKVWVVTGVVLVVLIVGAGCFWGGMAYGESHATPDVETLIRERMAAGGGQFPGGRRTGQGAGTGAGQGTAAGGGVMGTIEAIEDSVLVVNSNDGIVRVTTTETTLIQKMAAVEVDALDVGTTVLVIGSKNDDGTITARAVQSMQGRGFMQQGGGQ